jgi:hypothetical protein
VNIRVISAVLAVAALASMASCSSSAKSSDAGSSAAKSASSGGSGSAAAKSVDICSVLDAATAANIAGQPYTTATPQTGDWASQCAYNNDDSTAQGVNVTIFSGSNTANTWKVVHSGNVADISGLGDKAFWDNDNTLYAMSGSDLVQVNGLDNEANSEALAKPVLAALH